MNEPEVNIDFTEANKFLNAEGGGNFGGDGTFDSTDLSNWMKNSFNALCDRKFYQMILPGTHDSITYKFDSFTKGPATDEANGCLVCLDCMHCCCCFVCYGCKANTLVNVLARC